MLFVLERLYRVLSIHLDAVYDGAFVRIPRLKVFNMETRLIEAELSRDLPLIGSVHKMCFRFRG